MSGNGEYLVPTCLNDEALFQDWVDSGYLTPDGRVVSRESVAPVLPLRGTASTPEQCNDETRGGLGHVLRQEYGDCSA